MNKYHLCLVSVFFIACIKFFLNKCPWGHLSLKCYFLIVFDYVQCGKFSLLWPQTWRAPALLFQISNRWSMVVFLFFCFFPSPSFGDLKLMVKQKGFLYCWNCLKWRVGLAKFQKKKKKVFSVAALRTKKRRTFQIDLLSRADFDIYRMILAIFRCIGISICNSQ